MSVAGCEDEQNVAHPHDVALSSLQGKAVVTHTAVGVTLGTTVLSEIKQVTQKASSVRLHVSQAPAVKAIATQSRMAAAGAVGGAWGAHVAGGQRFRCVR